jgi:hypothetical protein
LLPFSFPHFFESGIFLSILISLPAKRSTDRTSAGNASGAWFPCSIFLCTLIGLLSLQNSDSI